MKQTTFIFFTFIVSYIAMGQGGNEDLSFATSSDLVITNTSVVHDARLAQLVFTIETTGVAGSTYPTAVGQMDGAPVLGYVFPTTLSSTDVGFGDTEGIVALALTSHPDFDDTPLWDEDNDRNYANDGVIWHSHWVILTEDNRVAGGLSVKQFEGNAILPPTNPGMPMYMDSPGFPVLTKGKKISVVVPTYRMNKKIDFNFDAVTAYMEVNTSTSSPLLGVYAVYSIASGDLSLPYSVTIKSLN